MTAARQSISDRADALVAERRFAEAYRLLAGPAAATDPQALYILAVWRLAGQVVRRDLAASRDYFRRAAEAGHVEAAAIYTAFVVNGTGGPPDWPAALALLEHSARSDAEARRQLDLISRMALAADGEPLRLPHEERLSDSPSVSCLRAFFTEHECAFLIAQAAPWLAPSLIVDPSGRQRPDPIRTSESMAFPFIRENPAVHALNRRIAAATGTRAPQGEPLQVLRYRAGQEYKPHSDAVTGHANQRILTFLVYLNEDYGGGETEFVANGLSFKGRTGDALLFRNTTADGRADPRAWHAGRPVTAGEKLVASRWIRQQPFLLTPPIPLLEV